LAARGAARPPAGHHDRVDEAVKKLNLSPITRVIVQGSATWIEPPPDEREAGLSVIGIVEVDAAW